MNIKTGYKQTEIGVIPDDWEVKNFGDVLKVCHGKSQHDVVVTDGEFPILATGGEIGRTNHYLYNKPSVLIGRKGTIDAPQYVEKPFWTIDTLFYTEISEKTSTKFIFYKFQTINWRGYNEASGVPSLNASTIERINFANPTLPEQTAIAAALSDVDALMGELDKLIAKKRDIKQATMQQLLTGKKRLAGFSGKWEVKRLGEVFGITAGGDLDKSNFSTTKDEKYSFPVYSNSLSDKGLYGYSPTYSQEENTITVTARGTVGFANARNHKYSAIGRVLVLSPLEKVSCFFVAEYINNKVSFANESTGVPQLTAPQISKYDIILPTYEEQTAIATILSDMDAEIKALQQKRDKTAQLKQGMMQELLTGRIRLVGASA